MAAEDAERWDARYADRDADPWVKAPEALAASRLTTLVPTHGRALDVACGLGNEALWLAGCGLHVTAIDASAAAIERVRASADRAGVAGLVDARQHDLDHGLPVDLGEFDVIVCQRFRDTSLYPEFIERLAPGGLLVVTVLSRTGASDPGPFHAAPGELRTAFDVDGCTILHHDERDGQESIVAERSS